MSPLDRKKLSKTTLEQIWAKRDSSGTRREHIVEVLIEQRRRSVDTQINQLRKKIAPYRKSIQDHRKACVGGDEIDRVGGYKLNIDIV